MQMQQRDPLVGPNYFANTNANALGGTSNIDFSTLGTTDLDFSANRAARMDTSFDMGDMDMDTSGEMNWQNWDQLVKQFGMDVDQGPGAGAATDWAGGNWDMINGTNLRMGMGMGGGDWF